MINIFKLEDIEVEETPEEETSEVDVEEEE